MEHSIKSDKTFVRPVARPTRDTLADFALRIGSGGRRCSGWSRAISVCLWAVSAGRRLLGLDEPFLSLLMPDGTCSMTSQRYDLYLNTRETGRSMLRSWCW